MSKYEAVIGLEIHAELKTNSKMFCGCANAQTLIHADGNSNADSCGWKPLEANTNICPICTGMPGVLPVLNKQAIEMTIKTGLALNCRIAKFTKWDRKNYFYPDLPKGYQISQYDLPICSEGYLEINSKSQTLNPKQITNHKSQITKNKIGITRIHLEEDTGTSKHPEGRADVDYSLLDYNRSGVPLMELVTDPDIKTAQEAKEVCQQYQLILRTLDVADADMEKGQMRCEANVSVRPQIKADEKISADQRGLNQRKSVPLGTKVEVKNLNSFKAVERAIEYEIERQTEVLESGEKVIQETRGWDDKKGQTYTMRVKETSADYRYFPEPDLPPVKISDKEIEQIKKQLPELPEQKKEKYVKEYKISEHEAIQISSSPRISVFFDKAVQSTNNYEDLGAWTVNDPGITDIDPRCAAELIDLVHDNKISKAQAKEILPEVKKGKSPEEIIKEKGLIQISNSSQLETIIDKVIKNNPDAVAKIKSGQIGVMGFLVGQVMKETKGQANPKLVNQILRNKLK